MRGHVGLFLFFSACGGSTNPPPADLSSSEVDMSADSPDMTVTQQSKIGGPCRQNAECTEGKSPVCWKSTLADQMGLLVTVDGYCSSSCVTDTDCATGSRCLGLSGNGVQLGKFCFATCTKAADCRSPGY